MSEKKKISQKKPAFDPTVVLFWHSSSSLPRIDNLLHLHVVYQEKEEKREEEEK